jgi:hypothetical protein
MIKNDAEFRQTLEQLERIDLDDFPLFFATSATCRRLSALSTLICCKRPKKRWIAVCG